MTDHLLGASHGLVPILQTERLLLRAPAKADFAPYAETLMSERCQYLGGWPLSAAQAYRSFLGDAGSWMVEGFGYWSVEARDSGAFVGLVGLGHPPHFAELELGWTVQAEAEGKGYATEAARAALGFAFGTLGVATLVSYIDEANLRSIAVAERLGAVRDATADRPDPEDLVYRHTAPGAG